ncbi:hypothetical protein D9757_004504 [Collybiopsis confluens]|uniref:Uncharacterized protein n=1 Tax=Collybiopsis confluens TaxID=2823264 RepID=A0A8H5HWL1_9AGAR|nr:hypothetical protein D9757_004504 [Collybiopsis confluens]
MSTYMKESQRSSRGRWCYFTMLSFKLRGSFFVTFALVVRAVLALSIPSELILEALDAEREYFGSSLRLPGPEVSGAEDGQARLDVVPVDPTEAFLSSLTEGRSLLNSLHKTGL